jgi:hypothetical protein
MILEGNPHTAGQQLGRECGQQLGRECGPRQGVAVREEGYLLYGTS